MRRALDTLYNAAAYLAALFLIGTLIMVLLGIFGRLLDFQVRGGVVERIEGSAHGSFYSVHKRIKRFGIVRASLFLRWCTCLGMSVPESHLAISVDGGLPFGTRFLEPVLQHRVADFFQVRSELRCGLDDGHAFLLQLV